MKTITVKADEEFDALLSRLSARTHRTRSAVIREAVRRYEVALDREEMKRRIRRASLATREQAAAAARELDAAVGDGLS